LRVGGSNPVLLCGFWIASLALAMTGNEYHSFSSRMVRATCGLLNETGDSFGQDQANSKVAA
jgi:hypothetical protein